MGPNIPRPALIHVALFATLVLISATASAAPIFKSDVPGQSFESLTLLDTPCSNDTVKAFIALKVPPELHGQFKDAILMWGSKPFASCYLEFEGYILSIDEEGIPLQPVPRNKFRESTI